LRVLETGEFLRVGSSKVQKTDVRVIAASNINFMHAINVGKFREDLYYRLNAVPIYIPPLRERKKDIHLLFKKFALDIADKYSMPAVKLDPQAQSLLESYRWTGNVRQLKNVAEQISVLENDRQITAEILQKYLPAEGPDILPVLAGETNNIGGETYSDRDLIFKILLQMNQMRQELDALKAGMASGNISAAVEPSVERAVQTLPVHINKQFDYSITDAVTEDIEDNVNVEEPKTLSIHDANTELILRALEKHHNNRKAAAEELGISERTLYRRLNDLNKTKK
jgi:DNA-binding NtrC family response regulator